MSVSALRRVEGETLSTRRRSFALSLPLFLLLFFIFSFSVHAEPAIDSPPLPASAVAVPSAASSPPPLSAAAQAMAAAAERQTEVRQVPAPATAASVAVGAAEGDGDADEPPVHPPLSPASPDSTAASGAPDDAPDASTTTATATVVPPPAPSDTVEVTTGDAITQSCSLQPPQLPFHVVDSCHTAPASSSTPLATPSNAAASSAASNATLPADRYDTATTTTTANTTAAVHAAAANTTLQPPTERDNGSVAERASEPKEKKNPIAELKQNVLKHIEEKKKEKEKEKKKEQLESDNHNHSSSNSSNATQAHPSPASSTSTSTTPSASTASPAPATTVPAAPSSSATPPSAVAVPAAATSAAPTRPSLIYPSPAPASISDRFNYAAYDSGAKLLLASPGMKKASAILSSDDDSYMMTPCSSEHKYVIVQLKEDILLDMIELVNREHYSSSIQHFSLYGSNVYPTDEWAPLGRFHADETQQAQYWRLDAPGDYAVRYVKLIWETWWKDEYYCTLTQLGVYGRSVLEAFREDLDDSAEVLREVEQVLIEHNQLAKDADVERKEASAVASQGEKSAVEAEAAIALTEAAVEISAHPSSSASSTLWDVVAFWTHQPSVEPVISQLMAVDEPPNIVVTAHSQSASPTARLSISSPVTALTDADKLFGQPVCPSFNVSQPTTLFFPHVHPPAAASIDSSSQSQSAEPSDTIIIITESNSDETSGSGIDSEAAEATAEDPAVVVITTDATDGDSTAPLHPSAASTSSAASPISTATSAAPNSASLFSGAFSASDFIYSQMARLSKQAGAQSQAEAEKIDPHYAALLAKYTGREKHKSTQSPSTTIPLASSSTAMPPSQDDLTHAGALPVSASASSSASDTVALVSAADAGKGNSKSSSHQSIFRTLTNRLKEVELHQALSTHFVSVLSERFGAEIEQLQTTLAKLKHSSVAQPGSDAKGAAAIAEDREVWREEVKAEVRRELQAEMQRVLDMQQRTEQRLAELSAANLSLHALLHQGLLALVTVLVLWSLLSSLLPPLPLRTVLWYVWRGVRAVVVWGTRSVWRMFVWLWIRAMHGWTAGSAVVPVVPKGAHRRSSSAGSSRKPVLSTSDTAPAVNHKQLGKVSEQPKNAKQQPRLQTSQRPLSKPPTNGHHPAQPYPAQQPQHTNNKRKSPPVSNPASPPLATSQPPQRSPSCSGDDAALESWQLDAIDGGSARPHMSPSVRRLLSPRRGSWSGQLADAGVGQPPAVADVVKPQQHSRSGSCNSGTVDSGGKSNTQPLPSRSPPPSPLPPLRPAPSIAPPPPPSSAPRLTAKHRSRTADAAHLPVFIRRAMPPNGAVGSSVGGTWVEAPASSPSSVVVSPYVSHASINSFSVLQSQSPEARNRPTMMVK